VVADAPVTAALEVIEKVNDSDSGTRAAFRANPLSFLAHVIEQAGGTGDVICEGDDDAVQVVMEYGERVLGITEWNGVRLSFKIPVYRQWFPDHPDETQSYTIEVPGSDIPLIVTPAHIPDLRDVIAAARILGSAIFTFGGKTYPASPDFEETVSKLPGAVRPEGGGKPSGKPAKAKLLVLRVAENAEDLVFNARLRDPKGGLARAPDPPMRSTPLPHQRDGIAWLRQAFLSGMPGVLLADDMGLGKTFQVLAFLHWLHANPDSGQRPILVVAPKKLLDVWRDEIREHIGPKGLGRPVLAYDAYLRGLKIEQGTDGELGRHTLDIDALRAADWVLTTYETLRDYHFSFAKVRFRVGVFDESQKMKSMASLINNAAKSQQPDFVILMTGTPIENSVMDLWTLLDVAWPGLLGLSGKAFAKIYGEAAGPEQFAELKRKMIEPVTLGARDCPPVMLRRFKSDVLEGLPEKHERLWKEIMPPEQVRAYDAVVANHRASKGSALQAIQALRQVAFHPELRMPSSPAEHDSLIAASARFRALFKVLDEAHQKGERVLIFVDLRLGQRVLGELIRHRYRMRRHPQVINGDTATKSLNAIKEDFQNSIGFDVLLLGPRSAGFGLTLTSANHVVHLNRWWNPAVEDQCSDRVYRIKQTSTVFIHLPVAIHPELADDSFDVVLNGMLSEKRMLSREIVVPTLLTEADFRRMFAQMMGDATSSDDVLDQLDRMGWRGFEIWAAERFRAAGYQVHNTPVSGDGGADIILRPSSGKHTSPLICQCKHRAMGGSTDEQAVNDVVRARDVYGERYSWLKQPVLVVVTNGEMTLAGRNLALEHQVHVVDRKRAAGLEEFAARALAGAA
jgi:HJR/Mrr/RecB family endonuclease